MKKTLVLTLFTAVAAVASAGDMVDRVAGVSPDTYVDFPVRAVKTVDVVVSNAVGSAVAKPLKFALKMPEGGEADGTALLGFRRYRGRCALFLCGKPVADFTDGGSDPMHILVDADALPEDRGDAYVQSLAPFSFADAFMVAEGDKTGLQSWEKLAGEWSLHAVTGRTVMAQDRGRLSRFPTQERSPNFYCLNGFGSHAVIAAGESFYSHYSVRAAIQQGAGTNGVAFMISDEGEACTFTAQQNARTGRLDFVLRSGCVAGERAGDFVAGVETELTPGQWYMLETRLTEDEVVCYVDDVPVIRASLPFPAGGRFGLYSSTLEAHPARFDDVSAETWSGTDFSLSREAPVGGSATFGIAGDPPAAISMRAAPPAGRSLGLFVGGDGEGGVVWRLVCETVDADGPRYRVSLVSESDGNAETNDTWLSDTPVKTPGAGESAREFTLDATAPGLVEGRVDNVTVVLARTRVPPVGRAGYVTDIEPRRRRGGFLSHPSVTRSPSPYTDRFEKNKIFVADPFMRHWASSEGQWLTYTNGTAWYKDDVLNRVSLSLPVLDGLDLRLGATEAPLATNGLPVADGVCDIRVLCSSNTLSVFNSAATNATPLYTWNYKPAAMTEGKNELTATNAVTLRFDGHRFAFSSATGAFFSCAVPYPHTGRRMFFEKVPPHYPAHVLVHREPVIDCLFDESLHDWTINGGTWEIINRFQCYPDWSHMDGENPESVAALWSKYDIAGDFCAMFICGMRHGGPWYDRVGDFNLTVLNNRSTPSEGYTLKVTDWDPNHSQRWSRLFRNGSLMARTDVKAAPRRREGNVRTGYEPLVEKGRDVHGAWYSIKFRRLGNRLEALFDNLPLLSVTDPEPLGSGGFGIWTYRSSMVVARVRVTAERISPHAFDFKPLDAADIAASPAPQPFGDLPNISFNGVPADLLRPELWHAADEVSCPEITFSEEGDEAVMTVTAIHGSGSFLASPVLPETTAGKLAGWTFEVARSPDAQFNFEFSLSGHGYTNHYSHIICGTEERRGPRMVVGRSKTPEATADGAKRKVWTPVTVWIPATGRDPRTENVVCDGFGNLQPSDIQQGLHGNGAGAWYAVRRMSPIYRETPAPDNASENAAAFSSDISRALDKGKAGRLNSYRVAQSACKTRPTIWWTLPPADNQGLIATVLAAPTNAIRIASSLDWPNPLICVSNVTVGGVSAPHAYIEDSALIIPYGRPFTPSHPVVKVSFATTGGRPFTQMLPASAFARPDGAPERAPSVTSLSFPPALGASYENFESRLTSLAPYAQEGTSRKLRHGDGEQSSYLHFDNAGRHSRLSGCLAPVFNVAKTPLLQFRYRGDDMALVNISPRNRAFFHFSDNYGGQERPAKLDDAWHTAFCRLSAVDFETYAGAIFGRQQNKLFFGSNHFSAPGIPNFHINQTGLFSYLDVDDIAIGPAIGPANTNDFRFLATFDAPDGIASAEYAILQGAAPYDSRSEDERGAIAWKPFAPSSTNAVTPSIDGLPEGTHHLLVRGTSPGGSASRVADMPFIYDATPPEISLGIADGADKNQNEALLTMNVGGGAEASPPMLTNILVTANSTRLQLLGYSGNVTGKSDNSISYGVKWALLARGPIQASTNGATIRFRVENVADGAGNVAPPVELSRKIDYASDNAAPTFTTMQSQMFIFAGRGEFPTRETFFNGYGKALEATHDIKKDADGATKRILSLKVCAKPEEKDAGPRIAYANFQNTGWLVPTNRWLMLRARVPEGAPAPSGNVFRISFSAQATPKDAKSPSKNNIYTLAIPAQNPTNGAARPAGLIQSGDFVPGKWVELVLDANAFLRAQADTTGDFRINRLTVGLPAVGGFTLELDAAAIMKDVPNLKRTIDFNAYDASGIDGIYIGDEKIVDGWRISYERLYERRGDSAFVSLRIRDRAGTSTGTPIIVPLPPRE